ncbi:MAG: DUF3662 and FHA domain-containing protein [Anaerolineae bacterium]
MMKSIAQLEAHLEKLIEGGFTRLFGRKMQAQDIALQLARAMQDGIRPAEGSDPRPIAPDQYMIYIHPGVQSYLIEKHPGLSHLLAEHMVELAVEAGYRLKERPTIKILADPALERSGVIVAADHTLANNSTAAMQRVQPVIVATPNQPQLVIDKVQTVTLDEHIVNIGRSPDNQIQLDDPHVSRHHVQLRLRDGAYFLFDVDSHSGTFVNGINIKEHRLSTGDVIRIGLTQMIYLEHDPVDYDAAADIDAPTDMEATDEEDIF